MNSVFNQAVGGRAPLSDPGLAERRMRLMSTYEACMILLTLLMLVVMIIDHKHKK